MKSALKTVLTIALTTLAAAETLGQKSSFESLALIPRTKIEFPVDYKIIRPRLEFPLWDKDFERFIAFLTPAIRKTQSQISFTDNGVVTAITPNSIIPHAQLDTSTTVNDEREITGTWRMLAFRSIRFTDSLYSTPNNVRYYRLPDTLLADRNSDDAFAVVMNNSFKLYVRAPGEQKFRKKMSSKYKVENNRFIMLYKFAKSSAGVSQYGIDEQGFLILNYPKVIEKIKRGEYITYTTIIEQYIFEKARQ